MAVIRCCVFVFASIIIIILGATFFHGMEKKRTSESEEDTSMSSILQNTKYNLSEDQVDDILKLLKENFVVERKSNLKRHSFAQWIYFVTSLVLTIDYNDGIRPRTDGEKIFTAFYTLISIPVLAITLHLTSSLILSLLHYMTTKIHKLGLPFYRKTEWMELLTSLLLLVIFTCLVTTFDIYTSTNLNFSNSFYQWLLVLFTIGREKESMADIPDYKCICLSLFCFLEVALLITFAKGAVNCFKRTKKSSLVDRKGKYVLPKREKPGIFYINEGIEKDRFHSASPHLYLKSKIGVIK